MVIMNNIDNMDTPQVVSIPSPQRTYGADTIRRIFPSSFLVSFTERGEKAL